MKIAFIKAIARDIGSEEKIKQWRHSCLTSTGVFTILTGDAIIEKISVSAKSCANNLHHWSAQPTNTFLN